MPSNSASLLLHDVHQTFARKGLSLPTNVLEVFSFQAIRKILRATDRIALLSTSVAKDEESFGLLRILPVEFEPILTPIGITTRANDELSPAAELMLRLVEEVCLEMKSEL